MACNTTTIVDTPKVIVVIAKKVASTKYEAAMFDLISCL